ncbi:unnamed protein product [Miscanthus lutarioriparius]|uniref:Uncharacterized protein n=1 Tax=Miscanthus lutarioriparius TaxID=422564 RepID=A0A811P3V9_9POAL|nr:unnamed protein product [Miscanthus lutarioriparius]
MAQKTVILYPSLGVGHLNPMVELAKVFLRRGLAVIIAVVESPDKDSVSAEALAHLAAANMDIAFRRLPVLSRGTESCSHPVMRTIDVLRVANPVLLGFLRTLTAVDAIVLDMFCMGALDVDAELNIPAYIFFSSALGDLAIMLHMPYYYPTAPSSFKDMPKTVLHFPGVPPIRALDMGAAMQDRDSDVAKARLSQCARMIEARGILVNSFDWLEARDLEALSRGLCTPGRSAPPVHCIGPLVLPGNRGGASERHACLEWLDTQPDQSVVFLSFGSLGRFSAPQLREIARGLENSGQRFLWVVRNPPEHRSNSVVPDLESLLPEGFLERRARCYGTDPSKMNKVHMVEELKVGVVMEGYEEELVKAEEVEAKVRLVMASGSGDGKELRQRLLTAMEMTVEVLKEGGSSDLAFDAFLTDLLKNTCTGKSGL